MRWFYKNKPFYILAFLVLVFGVFGNSIQKQISSYQKKWVVSNYQNAVLKAESLAFELLDTLSQNEYEKIVTFYKRLEKKYLDQGIAFYIYKNDSLKIWSNIEALPPSYFKEFYRPTYHETDNGSYLFFVKSAENTHWVVSINLAHHYLFSNKYLVENSILNSNISKLFSFGKPSSLAIDITLSSGQKICSLYEKDIKTEHSFYGILLFLILILWVYTARKSLTLATLPVITYCLFRIFNINDTFNSLEFFKPSLYAGNYLITSLGDVIFTFFAALQLAPYLNKKHNNTYIAYLISLTTGLLFYDISLNSIITLDTIDILKLNVWSILSFMAFGMSIRLIFKVEKTKFSKADYLALLIALALGTILIIALNLSVLILLFPATFFVIRYLYKIESFAVKTQIAKSLILASVGFLIVQQVSFEKSEKQIPLVAKKLINQRDHVAEFLLSDFRKNLIDDAYVKSFFTNPFLPKSAIEERLNKLYLRAYLKKFDQEILFLPKKTKFGYSPERLLADKVEQIISYQGMRISEGVYTTKLAGITNSYLTEQYFIEQKDTIGALYVLLTEKSFYDQSIYPELLIGKEEDIKSSGFNYAFYKTASLVSSFGQINYPLYYYDQEGEKQQKLITDYTHYFYKPDNGTTFIISLLKPSILQYISSFSVYLFILFVISVCLIWGKEILIWLPKTAEFWKKLSFSNRIRISTLGSVLAALLILAYATGIYTQKNYENESTQVLLKKIKKANLFFSNIYSNADNIPIVSDKLQEYVLQFSELYEADIDLFNKQGILIASSQKIIYENGILEKQLDGTAFYEIGLTGKSLFLKEERIGLLNYLSAFAPIIKNGQIEGYLQLPYFNRQEDLKQEQAGFFVALFNIYLIILVLLGVLTAFLVRTLTKPLSLITHQIKQTSLTNQNDKISWDKDDEIGLLITEYNAMVDKLEHSAKQLADNKQAEAWQEMAKQVAHEIKNPLTPMKLNIQQLQRAWKDEHHNLDNIFNKVTGILISQIESLAKIASEFSSFAKMPNLKLEKFELCIILEQIAQLYNAQKSIVFVQNNLPNLIITADKDQLFRAINNIVKNGIQAVGEDIDVKIDIGVKKLDESNIQILISDNGSGIEESKKDKIFIPNFSTKSSGMGLGLAIVKQVIENHGGSISFTTQIEEGTCFKLIIPINQIY